MIINQPVVVIGVGQLGGVFSRGFLKAGYPVYPILRGMNMEKVAENIPFPPFVLFSVPENLFHTVLKRIPDAWQDRLGFLQNELLPNDWEQHRVSTPTVMPIWFEKKKGSGVHVFRSTPVYGPKADIVSAALHALKIPNHIITDRKNMVLELVTKNIYVFTINIAGLKVGGTAGELWEKHADFAQDIAYELLDIQERLTGEKFDQEAVFSSVADVFNKVPEHNCRGRVAEDRLDRILYQAEQLGLEAPVLKGIKKDL